MENKRNKSENGILADKIWDDYYRVRHSKCYFGRLAHQYSRKDLCVRGFLAIATSAAVGGLRFWSYIPVIWDIISVFAVGTAILSTVFNFQKSMSESERLEGSYAPFSGEYRRLLSDAELGKNLEAVEQRYNYLLEKEELIQIPAKFKKYKEKLQKICQDEVDRDEGIQIGGAENV